MPFCTNCGHDNPDGSQLLRAVRRGLGSDPTAGETTERIPTGDTTKTIPPMVDEHTEPLTAEEEAAVSGLPSGSALLIVQRGANAGARFLVNTEKVTAGRHQDSDIFLDDISVSRRHATFTRTDEGIVVQDLGSLNGTYVNRDLVEEQLLRHGRRGADRQVPAGVLRQPARVRVAR